MRLWPDKFRTDKFSPFGEQLESRRLLDGHLRSVVADSAHMVADVNTTFAPHITVSSAVQFEGKLHFLVADGIGDIELWSSDGTAEGTSRISEIAANSAARAGGGVFSPHVVADELYFQLDRIPGDDDPTENYFYQGVQQLWKSDGSSEGTRFVTDLLGTDVMAFVDTQYREHDGRLFMEVNVCCPGSVSWLWIAPEHGEAPEEYHDMVMSWSKPIGRLLEVQGRWLFTGGDSNLDPKHGLWETNPDTRETNMIMGFEGDERGGGPYGLTPIGDEAIFVANGGQGYELWKTDGTTEGTQLVKDIVPGPDGSAPRYLTPVNDGVLFEINGAVWITDGTSAGTVPVAEDDPRSDWRRFHFIPVDGATPYVQLFRPLAEYEGDNLRPIGDLLFFHRDGTTWMSDATGEGSRSLGRPYVVLSEIDGHIILVDRQFLYRMDLETLEPSEILRLPAVTQESDPLEITASGNGVFFLGKHDGALRYTSAATDNSPSVTSVVSSADYTYTSYEFHNENHELAVMHPVGDKVFIYGANGLSVVDATTMQAELLIDDSSEQWRDAITGMTNVGDDLYFVRNAQNETGNSISEIWQSDGTVDGTSIIAGNIPNGGYGIGSQEPQIEYADGKIYFTAADSRLRVADLNGNVEDLGLSRVHSIAPLGDELYILREFFQARPTIRRLELWKSDGTPDGTTLVQNISNERWSANKLVAVNDWLYFGDRGGRLWRTDGVRDAELVYEFPLLDASYPSFHDPNPISELTPFGDKILFTVNDGIHGTELWESDGTTEGTRLAADVWPGFNGSRPTELTVLEDQIFFAANDGTHSRELWSIDIEVHEPLVGDADASGQVDFNDFLILSMNFGREIDATFEDGDFDDDGAVDFNDYLLLAANFERVVAS